ncbi:hypothetical protein GCM10010423_64950 [Streptomyces levis]|uniref:Uncharacterized protein n=1 Tax=Streptomyces levis TaxID=285566 RepID=A0ABN3P1Q9_9ACTN
MRKCGKPMIHDPHGAVDEKGPYRCSGMTNDEYLKTVMLPEFPCANQEPHDKHTYRPAMTPPDTAVQCPGKEE